MTFAYYIHCTTVLSMRWSDLFMALLFRLGPAKMDITILLVIIDTEHLLTMGILTCPTLH